MSIHDQASDEEFDGALTFRKPAHVKMPSEGGMRPVGEWAKQAADNQVGSTHDVDIDLYSGVGGVPGLSEVVNFAALPICAFACQYSCVAVNSAVQASRCTACLLISSVHCRYHSLLKQPTTRYSAEAAISTSPCKKNQGPVNRQP